MANKHLCKYTDENYLTRSELRVAMRSNIIDDFYKEIRQYRKENAEKTPLIGTSRSPLFLTKTEATKVKLDFFQTRLDGYSNAIADLSLNPSAERSFEKEALLSVLMDAAKLISCPLPEITAKAMLNGFFKPGENEKEALLHRFYQNLRKTPQTPSEDSLGELRFALLGHDEVSSFYRTSDFRTIYTTQIVDRNYNYAPFGEIEGMMESLFSFLSSPSYPVGMKAVLSLYYIYFVKPFEENNELIATSFARGVLSSSGISGACYLPFEALLQNSNKLKDVLLESQKECDLTYFAFYCFDRLGVFFDQTISRLSELKAETVAKEFVQIPKEEVEEAKEEIEEAPALEVEEENLPPSPPEKAPPKVPLLSEEERKAFLESKGKSAVASPSPSLSDKEVKETAKYLLETNPLLRKKQALFYASHCTIGRFYTIQDFKKAARCAYETARTSMDGLAELGFYEKKQIKNKFVYTPINQGETK